jgi:predicted regulator of Ras-like GTPase activity (Roadblock/LC7/MglB family)
MKRVLDQINVQQGVIGSLVCDFEGGLLAKALSSDFAPGKIEAALLPLAEGVAGMEHSIGSIGMLEYRYSDHRVVIRRFDGGMLLLICSLNVNMQLISITINVAMKKLEKLINSLPLAPPVHEPAQILEPVKAAPVQDQAMYISPFGNFAAVAPTFPEKKKKKGGWTLADLD